MNKSKMMKRVFIKYMGREKGFGLIADQPICIGMPIVEYTGIYQTNDEACRASEVAESAYRLTALPEVRIFYELYMYCNRVFQKEGVHPEITIDAKNMGNVARFINHSCMPNVRIIRIYPEIPGKHEVCPLPCVMMVSIAPIKKGDELTFSYETNYFAINRFPCLCYEPVCYAPPGTF